MDAKRIARFWAKVDKSAGPDGCWPWSASRNAAGYGYVGIDGRTTKAHRVAFLLHRGRWPDPLCCHHCDNPPCCNPAHLFEGDHAANTHDMCNKGRGRGLTAEQHAAILAHPRQSHRVTANRMGVFIGTVYKIRAGHRVVRQG